MFVRWIIMVQNDSIQHCDSDLLTGGLSAGIDPLPHARISVVIFLSLLLYISLADGILYLEFMMLERYPSTSFDTERNFSGRLQPLRLMSYAESVDSP
jgi:hypothetical protein